MCVLAEWAPRAMNNVQGRQVGKVSCQEGAMEGMPDGWGAPVTHVVRRTRGPAMCLSCILRQRFADWKGEAMSGVQFGGGWAGGCNVAARVLSVPDLKLARGGVQGNAVRFGACSQCAGSERVHVRRVVCSRRYGRADVRWPRRRTVLEKRSRSVSINALREWCKGLVLTHGAAQHSGHAAMQCIFVCDQEAGKIAKRALSWQPRTPGAKLCSGVTACGRVAG